METTRSKQATIAEKVVKVICSTKSEALEEMTLSRQKATGNEQKYTLPLFLKSKPTYQTNELKDLQVFTINNDSKTDYIIFYLHGGGYVREFLPFHWAMLDKIAEKLQSLIVVPDYPLAPIHSYQDSYKLLTKLYLELLDYYPNKKIIFMGDSAGGGLALGLAEYFKSIKLPQPYSLILLSPWIDLKMDNPEIENYVDLDPMLKRDSLSIDANYWANGTPLEDYRLSPINGDITGLPHIALFVGTHEILYPDIIKFYNILQANNISSELHIGEGLNHVYPAYPIPEGEEAIQQIIKIIKNN